MTLAGAVSLDGDGRVIMCGAVSLDGDGRVIMSGVVSSLVGGA